MNTTTLPDLSSVASLALASQPPTYPVRTIPPTVLDTATHQLVSWARRSTEKTPVPEAERFRGCIIPRAFIPSDACTSKFARLFQSTVDALFDERFTAWVRENMSAPSILASLLTLDAVLLFWAEERQRCVIDAAKITAWLLASATYAALPPATAAVWAVKLPKIAAPGYRSAFTRGQAAAIVAKIADSDIEAPEAMFILMRCQNVLASESEAM